MNTFINYVLGLLLLVLPNLASAQQTRDWRTWPFASDSPWNHPIGSGAQYTTVSGLNSLPISINYGDRFTTSVKIGRDSDPLVQLFINTKYPQTNWSFLEGGGKVCGNTAADESYIRSLASQTLPYQGNTYSTISTPDDSQWILPIDYHRASQDIMWSFRLPSGSCPSPDSDAHMAVFQPNGWVLETYGTVVLSNGDTVSDQIASYTNAKGQGTGWDNGRKASMIPNYAGLIRTGEISSGRIPHALVATMPAFILMEKAMWPAYAFDRNSGYTGTLPMGALLAIPASVDLNSLGLTAKGMIIAKAAQDYGIYAADRGGGGMTIQAELGNPEIRWTNDGNDMAIIVRHLRWISNNSPTSRGGGGTPRAAFAPPFSDIATTSTTTTTTTTTTMVSPADTIAPEVSIVSPVNGALVQRGLVLSIQASATDNVAVAKVDIYVNGSLRCSDSLAPYSCNYKLSKKPGVSYRIQARAYDRSGNQAISTEITITSR